MDHVPYRWAIHRRSNAKYEEIISRGRHFQDIYSLEKGESFLGARGGSLANEILDTVPSNHKLRSKALPVAAQLLSTRYQREESYPDLIKSIACYSEYLDLNPKGRKDRPLALIKLAEVSWYHHTRHEGPKSNDGHKEYIDEALELSPPGSPHRIDALLLAGQIIPGPLRKVDGVPIRRSDIEKAIDYVQEALIDCPTENPSLRATALRVLADLLRFRSRTYGSAVMDLSTSLKYARQSLDLLPSSSLERGRTLVCLADSLRGHYETTGEPSSLDAAVEHLEEATELLANTPWRQREAQSDLSYTLSLRYQNNKDLISDLDRAIQLQQHVSEQTTSKSRLSGTLRTIERLGILLDLKYNETQDGEDLERAIETWRTLLKCAPTSSRNHFHRASLRYLADAIEKRYRLQPVSADLTEVIALRTQLVETSRDGDKKTAGDVEALHRVLEKVPSESGSRKDEISVDARPTPDMSLSPTRPSGSKSSLFPSSSPPSSQSVELPLTTTFNAPSLLYDFDPANINNVIGDFKHRLTSGLPTDRLHNMRCLAEALRMRYTREGDRIDLEDAVRLERQAGEEEFWITFGSLVPPSSP